MNRAIAALLAMFALCGAALASEGQGCDIPGYLLFGTSELKRVPVAVRENHRLRIVVVGTGSSALAGPDGASSAFPARLEARLRERLLGVDVSVIALVRTR